MGVYSQFMMDALRDQIAIETPLKGLQSISFYSQISCYKSHQAQMLRAAFTYSSIGPIVSKAFNFTGNMVNQVKIFNTADLETKKSYSYRSFYPRFSVDTYIHVDMLYYYYLCIIT